MEKKYTRGARMSKVQKESLITFLENNRILLENKVDPSQIENRQRKWKELANTLNAQQGANKTVEQWKDAFNELKSNVRKKARALHLDAKGTGGGPKTAPELSPFEDRVLGLISRIVINGMPDLPEAGLNLEQQQTEEELVHFESVDLEIIEPMEEVMPSPSILSKRLTLQDPTKKRKRTARRQETPGSSALNSVAQRHEECLRLLAASNNRLAMSNERLAQLKQKRKSAVFSLKF